MFKRIIAVLMLLSLILAASGCGQAQDNEKTRYEAEFLLLFDTVTRIVAYTDSKDEFSDMAQFIHDKLEEYHQLYDIYNDYEGINNIKTINDNAGIAPVKVDARIIDLLKFAKQMHEFTGGKINVAFGPVLKIWHDYRTEGIDDPENARLPELQELTEANVHTNIDDVIIDEAASTVFLKYPDMRLDVGAVAKGYAVEQVCTLAMQAGYTSALVSVGGNIRAIGDKGVDGKLWNVGVQNPDKQSSERLLEIVYMEDASSVTSGNYERYYTVNGRNYHHIIDPKTLFPAEYFTSITILCRDSGVADALSTALFNMPYEEGLAFINSIPDAGAMWMFNDGELRYSDYFLKFTKE